MTATPQQIEQRTVIQDATPPRPPDKQPRSESFDWVLAWYPAEHERPALASEPESVPVIRIGDDAGMAAGAAEFARPWEYVRRALFHFGGEFEGWTFAQFQADEKDEIRYRSLAGRELVPYTGVPPLQTFRVWLAQYAREQWSRARAYQHDEHDADGAADMVVPPLETIEAWVAKLSMKTAPKVAEAETKRAERPSARVLKVELRDAVKLVFERAQRAGQKLNQREMRLAFARPEARQRTPTSRRCGGSTKPIPISLLEPWSVALGHGLAREVD